MPYWWWIIPALAGFAALGLLATGLGAVGRHRPYRVVGGIVTGGVLFAAAAVLLLLGLDIQTFSHLT